MFKLTQKDNKFTIKGINQTGKEIKKVIELKPDENDNDYWELGQLLAELSIYRGELL